MKVIDANPSSPELSRRIGGVIVTHGHLATEFIAAAEMIVGPIPHVTPVSPRLHRPASRLRRTLVTIAGLSVAALPLGCAGSTRMSVAPTR